MTKEENVKKYINKIYSKVYRNVNANFKLKTKNILYKFSDKTDKESQKIFIIIYAHSIWQKDNINNSFGLDYNFLGKLKNHLHSKLRKVNNPVCIYISFWLSFNNIKTEEKRSQNLKIKKYLDLYLPIIEPEKELYMDILWLQYKLSIDLEEKKRLIKKIGQQTFNKRIYYQEYFKLLSEDRTPYMFIKIFKKLIFTYKITSEYFVLISLNFLGNENVSVKDQKEILKLCLYCIPEVITNNEWENLTQERFSNFIIKNNYLAYAKCYIKKNKCFELTIKNLSNSKNTEKRIAELYDIFYGTKKAITYFFPKVEKLLRESKFERHHKASWFSLLATLLKKDKQIEKSKKYIKLFQKYNLD